MKEKGCSPRYRCRACGHEFAARSGFNACRKCKNKPGLVPFKCIRLGWDGVVHRFKTITKGLSSE